MTAQDLKHVARCEEYVRGHKAGHGSGRSILFKYSPQDMPGALSPQNTADYQAGWKAGFDLGFEIGRAEYLATQKGKRK